MIAAIVYWNSTYLADAVQHLRNQGGSVSHVLLARTSPLTWEHMSYSGDFLWGRDRAATMASRRRPLGLGLDRMIGVPGLFEFGAAYMTADGLSPTVDETTPQLSPQLRWADLLAGISVSATFKQMPARTGFSPEEIEQNSAHNTRMGSCRDVVPQGA